MLVTLSGMVMFVRFLQSENAELPMLVTLSGIVMLVRFSQRKNALPAISFVPAFMAYVPARDVRAAIK